MATQFEAKERRRATRRTHSNRPARRSIGAATEKIQNTIPSRIVPRSNCESGRGDLLERNKWLDVFADLPLASSTPMGTLLREDPASRKLLGAGRRGGTIRARVRAIRKFLSWHAVAHELPYPTSHMHVAEFPAGTALAAEGSDSPHARGVCFHGRTGRSFGKVQLEFSVRHDELTATSLVSKESKQAPRFPLVVLAALEALLSDPSKPVFFWIMAWWHLLQP